MGRCTRGPQSRSLNPTQAVVMTRVANHNANSQGKNSQARTQVARSVGQFALHNNSPWPSKKNPLHAHRYDNMATSRRSAQHHETNNRERSTMAIDIAIENPLRAEENTDTLRFLVKDGALSSGGSISFPSNNMCNQRISNLRQADAMAHRAEEQCFAISSGH